MNKALLFQNTRKKHWKKYGVEVDRHGSGKRPGTGTNKTGSEVLVSAKCGKFLGYLNEGIPKEGAVKNIWPKNGINNMKMETVSH